MNRFLSSKWTKVVVFLLCLVPLAWIAWKFQHDKLGVNPIRELEIETGLWTLRMLAITLAVTPVRRALRWNWLVKYRRMLGLFAFFYVSLHFLTYLGPDQSFDLSGMWKDVAKRPFITMGFAAFVLLIPLAMTSTAGWIRRLGGKRWQLLHRSIYVAAVCGVIHYYWLVKSDVRKPVFYGALVGILLLWRLGNWFFKKGSAVAAKLSAQRAPANSSQ